MAKNANPERIKPCPEEVFGVPRLESTSRADEERGDMLVVAGRLMDAPNPLRELVRDLPRGIKITIETT